MKKEKLKKQKIKFFFIKKYFFFHIKINKLKKIKGILFSISVYLVITINDYYRLKSTWTQ